MLYNGLQCGLTASPLTIVAVGVCSCYDYSYTLALPPVHMSGLAWCGSSLSPLPDVASFQVGFNWTLDQNIHDVAAVSISTSLL